MAKEGLHSEESGSENHTKESTQAADKTHRHATSSTSTHMQMTWNVKVAHDANGRMANKVLLAANSYFITLEKRMQRHYDKTHATECKNTCICTASSDCAKQLPGMIQ